jgi:CBS domain-containing protein
MKIREVMTPAPVTVASTDMVTAAAKAMKEQGVGVVPVITDGRLTGIITDRDIAVRVLAEDRDPAATRVGDVCSTELASVGLDDDVTAATRLMRERAVRRVPVLDDGVPVGIVSIGDLALTKDERSALADVSAAPPNL